MKKYILIFLAVCLTAASGCSQTETVSDISSTPSSSAPETAISSSVSPEGSDSQILDSQPSADSSVVSENVETQAREVTLYIGMDEDFKEYPVDFEGDISTLTPDFLIQSMSELTGWDLTLSDTVTTGKGGMTVSFSKDCALFSGPPEPQKEEFFVYSTDQLVQTILDSIQHTLQYNFVDPTLGDPSSLPIYYCMEGDQPLNFVSLNLTFPIDEPYPGWPKG